MCRLSLFLSKNEKGKNEFYKFLESYFKAGSRDYYLKEAVKKFNIKGIDESHFHGWGYLLLNEEDLFIYKTKRDVREDYERFFRVNNLKTNKFLFISLIRTTDIGYVSVFESHPFTFVLKDKEAIEEVYLVYNGLVDVEKIGEYLGFNVETLKNRNSTYSMLFLLEKFFLEENNFEKALKKLQDFAKSAANIIALTVGEKNKAYVMHYVRPKILEDELMRNYYSMVVLEEDNFVFAGNKIIMEYFENKFGKRNFRLMENGEILSFDVDFVKKEWFDGYKET